MAQGPKPEVTGRFPDQPAEGGEEVIEHDLEQVVTTTPGAGEDDVDAEDLDGEDEPLEEELPLDEPGDMSESDSLKTIDTTKGLP